MNIPDNVTREELFAMVVWLAGYQDKLNDLRHKALSGWRTNTGDHVADMASAVKVTAQLMMEWPIIQGSRNQTWLKRIGELDFDNAACGRALEELGSHATVEAFRKSTGEEKP